MADAQACAAAGFALVPIAEFDPDAHLVPPVVHIKGFGSRMLLPGAPAPPYPLKMRAQAELERTEDGSVKPWKTTPTADRYKVRFVDPTDVKNYFRMHEWAPSRGWQASMLMLPAAQEKRGKLGKTARCANARLAQAARSGARSRLRPRRC